MISKRRTGPGSRETAPRLRSAPGDAFAKLSGMPASYFEAAETRFAPSDLSALRFFLALRTASRRIDTTVSGWLQRSDLTVTKFDVLHLLAAEARAGATVGRLREYLRMTQPNVTFVVNSLVRAGLARRTADPADRRSSIVRITAKGLAVVDRLTPAHMAAIGRAVSSVPERDRERFTTLLAGVVAAFEDEPAPD